MPPIRRLKVLASVLVLGLLVARCGGDGGVEPTDPVPTTIQIANATITLDAIGSTATLAVTVLDQDGDVIANPSVQFTSLDTNVASVSAGGVVTAEGEGQTDITVTSGQATATASVTVDQVVSSATAASGNGQTGAVGEALADPLVVSVTDSEGHGIEGETVSFDVSADGGSVSPTTVATDASGEASTTWTLGQTPGQHTVTASVAGTSATFDGTAEAGPPAQFQVTGGGQQGVAGFALLESLTVLVEDEFGNVLEGETVSFAASDGGSTDPSSLTSGASPSTVDWTLGGAAGEQTLTVSAGSAEEVVTATAVNPAPLALGAPAANQSADAGEALHYTFQTPAAAEGADGSAAVTVRILRVSVSGGSGDRDLYLRRGSPPGGDGGGILADCSDVGPGTSKLCEFQAPPPDTWFATVVGGGGFTGASIVAEVLELRPDLVAGGLTVTPSNPTTAETVTIEGSITNEGTNESGTFMWSITVDGNEVAGGTVQNLAVDETVPVSADDVGPFAEGQHTATLTVDTKSETGDPDESDNTSETDFTVGAVPTGMITIQKVIQASDGGPPDNPADPALDGFEFEIKDAGTSNVVATVTTDAAGQAKATLPVGDYDVTESNSQGLTDVTQLAADQSVTDGGNVDIDWINRQEPVEVAPTAVINAAPMSVPSGDGNQTVVLLYGGNSTDPQDDPLTYTWTAQSGTFEGGVNTGEKVNVTFPGVAPYLVTLTVDDGNGNQDQAEKTIALGPALPPAGTFDIEIMFIDNAATQDPTTEQMEAFDNAEDRWESIIRSELGNISFGAPGSGVDIEASCTGTDPDGDGTPGNGTEDLNGIVDDLKIFVFLVAIDGPGKTLGSAGPCFIRTPAPSGLPVVGTMRFDVADLAALEADGILDAVILHEMGHVFGLGTLWSAPNPPCSPFGFGFLVDPSLTAPTFGPGCSVVTPRMNIDPPPDTRYDGPMGVAAWRSMGGGNDADVPIENGAGPNEGGPGNRDGHWRDVTFTIALMTAFISSSDPSSPLTKLTIASLEDMGYVVNYAPADPFTLPDPFVTAPPIGTREGVRLLDDIRRGPIWVVDENGRVVNRIGRE